MITNVTLLFSNISLHNVGIWVVSIDAILLFLNAFYYFIKEHSMIVFAVSEELLAE